MSGGSVKRLQREFKNSQQSPIREFLMYPCEDNMFEWHFTMMGPPDSPYSEGFYHGRILIPTNYPFAPPDVVLITPNGRFELEKRICLSISSYHPENWHPTWGIPTVLHALREFMLTPGNNAIGAIDYPNDVKVRMASQSAEMVCPDCEAKIAEHKQLLLDAPPATEADKVKAKEEALPTPDLKAQSTPTANPTAAPSGDRDNSSFAMTATMSDMSPLPATGGKATPDPTPTGNTALDDSSASSSNTPTPPPPRAAEGAPAPPAAEPTEPTPVETKQAAPLEGRDANAAPPVAAPIVVAAPAVPAPPAAPPAVPAPEPEVAVAAAPAARAAPVRQMEQGGFEINISVSVLDKILFFLFVVIMVLTCKKVMFNHASTIWAAISRVQQSVGF